MISRILFALLLGLACVAGVDSSVPTLSMAAFGAQPDAAEPETSGGPRVSSPPATPECATLLEAIAGAEKGQFGAHAKSAVAAILFINTVMLLINEGVLRAQGLVAPNNMNFLFATLIDWCITFYALKVSMNDPPQWVRKYLRIFILSPFRQLVSRVSANSAVVGSFVAGAWFAKAKTSGATITLSEALSVYGFFLAVYTSMQLFRNWAFHQRLVSRDKAFTRDTVGVDSSTMDAVNGAISSRAAALDVGVRAQAGLVDALAEMTGKIPFEANMKGMELPEDAEVERILDELARVNGSEPPTSIKVKVLRLLRFLRLTKTSDAGALRQDLVKRILEILESEGLSAEDRQTWQKALSLGEPFGTENEAESAAFLKALLATQNGRERFIRWFLVIVDRLAFGLVTPAGLRVMQERALLPD